MGAPHQGIETKALEILVRGQATEDMIRELTGDSPTLRDLNDKFRHVAKHINILSCYEQCLTKSAIEVRPNPQILTSFRKKTDLKVA